MPKKIIILDNPTNHEWRAAFWLIVPAGRETFYVKDAEYTSQWKGASTEENEALRAGQVKEVIETRVMNPSWTLPQIMAGLEAKHAELQAELDAYNIWTKYGSYWDGTSWTEQGVS